MRGQAERSSGVVAVAVVAVTTAVVMAQAVVAAAVETTAEERWVETTVAAYPAPCPQVGPQVGWCRHS
jgi:hypothetical protein